MDKNGIWLTKVFHLYGGFYKNFSIFGSFVKISVKTTKSTALLLKKSKIKGILILTKKEIFNADNSFFKFKFNTVILLKRRLTSLGREITGPGLFNLNRKRFLFSFAGIL